MAERVGLSSTDLPDARNPTNKGLLAVGENRCVPPMCTTFRGLRQSQLAFVAPRRGSSVTRRWALATWCQAEGWTTSAEHPLCAKSSLLKIEPG